uniref:Carboxylic ester hydrolase n=1 Tax=Panagrolaimus sp. JU765 TaxID=591449 RepID=A0AC34QW96_9BILA
MEWVKKNIKLFGGDPNRLTLMGHSGGANVVNYLAVSPKAQTLFNQLAIMSRGSQSDELIPDRNQKASRMTAIKLGCTSADESDEKWENVTFVEDVIDCLRNKTAREISSWQKILEPDGYIFQSVSLDYGDDALLPTIYELLDKKRLPTPLITGTVSREFLDSRDTLQTLTLVNQKALREWCQVLPKMMGYAASESALDLCMVEYNTRNRRIIRNESEFVDIVFTNDTSPEMPSNFEGAGGTNWQLFFWIAFALLMIALIFAILSWIVANRKKHDYQEM